MSVSVEVDRYAECRHCGHYPAYHDRPENKCRAWTDVRGDGKCECPGWEEKPAAAPAPFVSMMPDYDQIDEEFT